MAKNIHPRVTDFGLLAEDQPVQGELIPQSLEGQIHLLRALRVQVYNVAVQNWRIEQQNSLIKELANASTR